MSEMISDCCGAAPVAESEDIGICPECQEHCEYIEDVCETCDGAGEITHGHYADDNSWTERCPDCSGTGECDWEIQ
jgi:DnaJ-class molecular chaperone